MNEISDKRLEKAKKAVLKKIPNALLKIDFYGYCYILDGDIDLSEEYLLPETKSPTEAWELALLSIRTTQNFNRTHPMKVDIELSEKKLGRIRKRKARQKKNLSSLKDDNHIF